MQVSRAVCWILLDTISFSCANLSVRVRFFVPFEIFRMRSTLRVLFLGLVLLPFGCGGQPSFDNHVTGDVTFDGQPIGDGTITFTPKDGKGLAASSPIKGGLFGLDARPGAYQVEIQSPEMSGGKQTREIDVPSEGPKKIKLELKSK
jgi:hypothetical protein